MTETLVRFPASGGGTLAGTLTRPDTPAASLAGAVLVAGSGPTDRDGNQAGLQTDLLKQIAQALAQAGIASLRYDKRGMGRSDKPATTVSLSNFTRWERYRDDVVGAAGYLRSQGIAVGKLVLIGHSEGGVLCLQAVRTVKPAVLVLISTPGRPLSIVIEEQLNTLLLRQKATLEQRRYFLSENDRISREIIRTGKVPTDVPAGLAALYPAYLGPFLQNTLPTNPAKDAAQVVAPTLIVQGEKDTQVSPARDATALNRSLKGTHELFIVPGASHNLKRSADTFSGAAAPEALRRITTWLGKTIVPTKNSLDTGAKK